MMFVMVATIFFFGFGGWEMSSQSSRDYFLPLCVLPPLKTQ